MIIKQLNETRKEDDFYLKGAFWVVGESVHSILTNKFDIIGTKFICTFDGNLDRRRPNRKNETHEVVWKNFSEKYNNVPYNYFPRGRVEIYNGMAYININSILNTPNIIDRIRKEYEILKLDYTIGLNDLEQGSHYDFLLK